jgi:hypothetical protein
VLLTSSACSSFSSTSDPATTPGENDAGVDGVAPVADAAQPDGGSCGHLICEDFQGPRGPSADWSQTTPAAMTLVDGEGPGNEAWGMTLADGEYPGTYISHGIPAGTTRFTCSAKIFVEAGAKRNVEIMRFDAIDDYAIYAELDPTGTLMLSQSKGSTGASAPVNGGIPQGQWTKLTLQIDIPQKKGAITIGTVTSPANLAFGPETLTTLSVGLRSTNSDPGPWKARVDDITCDFLP